MLVYTVCHKDFGYTCHSYIWADNMEQATILANEKFDTVKSVMKLND